MKVFFEGPIKFSSAIFHLALWIPVLFYFVIYSAYTFPSEDAAILFAYAENWAKTGVISYYPGGAATEGATDFLFLCLVTSGIKTGLSAHASSLIISALSLSGSIYLIDKLANSKRLFVRLSWIFAFVFAQQIYPGIYGYGTLLFGFGLISSIYFFQKNQFPALVIAALLTVLCRPDGIIMITPLVLYRWLSESSLRKERFFQMVMWGIVPGMIYYTWRLYYFQEWFPLPFYVKTQGERAYGIFQSISFYTQIHYIRFYLYPMLAGLIIAGILYWRHIPARVYVIAFSFLVLPFIFYSTTQQDMNLGYRYQYPIYIGFIALSAVLIQLYRAEWLAFFVILNALIVLPVHQKSLRDKPFQIENNYVKVVRKLQKYDGAIAATDAGYIGWLSHWQVNDLWGLNTPEFSRKLASPEDIKNLRPDLVEIAPYNWDSSSTDKTNKTFHNLIQNTYLFLHKQDYQIWRLPYPESTYQDLVWTPEIDSFFRTSTHLSKRRNTDTVTFGIRKDFRYARDLEVIFREHGGIVHDNLLPDQPHN